MRPVATPAIAFGVLLLVLLGATAAPSGALSCASHPDGSPQAILAGTAGLSTADRFFDRYEFAVLGTVTAVDVDENPAGGSYGATTITMSLTAAYGSSSAPTGFEFSSPDPGWLNGYPFSEGRSYFVPINTHRGQGADSHLCDPITEVVDVGLAQAELTEIAASGGVPTASLVSDDGTTLRQAPAEAEQAPTRVSDEPTGWAAETAIVFPGLGVSAALVAIGVGVAVRRRRGD